MTFIISYSFYFYFSFSGTNLMGKFTQSVKRIVQEVKEDGTQGKFDYVK